MKYTFSITTVGTPDRPIKSNIFLHDAGFRSSDASFVSCHAQILAWKPRSEDGCIRWNISHIEDICLQICIGESKAQDVDGIPIDFNKKIRLEPSL